MSNGAGQARLGWGDALKGLLIIGVVFWHVVLKTYLQIDWRIGVPIPGAWGVLNDAIWPFLMPLFLALSGVFAANALQRPWARVWRPRIVRFVYLYLLWTLIHMATMWAFPEFPTFVPRSVAEFIEGVTISPPNSWYVYALALYFLIAKGLQRLPRWVLIVASGALSVVVAAGFVDVVSNRGSLLYNLLFFLIGAYAAPRIHEFTSVRRPLVALGLVVAYGASYATMYLTGSKEVPGVWPIVSLLGVAMGFAMAPILASTRWIGGGLTWLGTRTLPIYLIHMPVLVLIDFAVVGWVSEARLAVQFIGVVALPVLITAAAIAISAWLGALVEGDQLTWLFELPQRNLRQRPAPWRTGVAMSALVAVGIVISQLTAIPNTTKQAYRDSASRDGEVSVGAAGDILIYNASSGIPADRGAGYFDQVRDWFTEDLVTGNLEQAITPETGEKKCRDSKTCLLFRSEPDAVAALQGFDVLNLANNHSRDYGPVGYQQTRSILSAVGIRTVGDRNEIRYEQVGTTLVAFVSFAPYAGFNRNTNLRHVEMVVREAKKHADLVVVHSHMGAEGPDAHVVKPGVERMFGENRADVMAFSHKAVDSGADLVIGHGPHILRGFEMRNGRLIAYSLGNFGGGGVFGQEPETRYGAYLSVRLAIDGRVIAAQVRSVRFDFADGVPMPDPGNTAAAQIAERSARDFPTTHPKIRADGEIVLP